jgi:hypothetical protein
MKSWINKGYIYFKGLCAYRLKLVHVHFVLAVSANWILGKKVEMCLHLYSLVYSRLHVYLDTISYVKITYYNACLIIFLYFYLRHDITEILLKVMLNTINPPTSISTKYWLSSTSWRLCQLIYIDLLKSISITGFIIVDKVI